MIILLYKGDDRPAFRKYHNPGDVKINMTDKLVTTYQGKESQLYRLICKETYFSDDVCAEINNYDIECAFSEEGLQKPDI